MRDAKPTNQKNPKLIKIARCATVAWAVLPAMATGGSAATVDSADIVRTGMMYVNVRLGKNYLVRLILQLLACID